MTVKLNDRNDRITDEALGDTVQWTVETQGSNNDRKQLAHQDQYR